MTLKSLLERESKLFAQIMLTFVFTLHSKLISILFLNRIVPESSKREDFRIHIEFLTWPIIRYKREVLFGWVDLLVSFGGIAGLFLGFSLLSGVEIIYYFTMRAGCMLYKNRVGTKLCFRTIWLKFLFFVPGRALHRTRRRKATCSGPFRPRHETKAEEI